MTPYATLGGGRQPEIRLYQGDTRDVLARLPAASVACCITSPPYWGLRAYLPNGHADKAQELGSELLPFCQQWERGPRCGRGCWICAMVEVFEEVKRVLRDDGTLWLNCGDTMAGHNLPGWRPGNEQKNGGHSNKNGGGVVPGIPAKNTLGLPWRLALALQAAGWWLRSEMIWAKLNPLPESVTDRPTKAHEQVFLLTKAPRYYFDHVAVREPSRGAIGPSPQASGAYSLLAGRHDGETHWSGGFVTGEMRSMRSVLSLASESFPGAHFAVMPSKLVEPCVLAGSSAYGVCSACGAPWCRVVERGLVNTAGWGMATKDHHGNIQQPQSMIRNGQGRAGDSHTTTTGWQPSCTCNAGVRRAVVLDIFAGSGTTGLVAQQHGRDAILIDLSQTYLDLAVQRLTPAFAQLPLFGLAPRAW